VKLADTVLTKISIAGRNGGADLRSVERSPPAGAPIVSRCALLV